MSAAFAFSGLVMAFISRRAGHPTRVQIPILYFATMELLQTVQYMYLAVPEDDYAMCKSPINQYLTVAGFVHIIFQPYFCNMAVTATSRTRHVRYRFENDMISKLCLVFAVWCLVRYGLAIYSDEYYQRPTEDCPNYEWVRDGYDAHIRWSTPNLPGHSCTFESNTPTKHLGWALPLVPASYFLPGVSLHSFLMFVPSLVSKRHIFTGVMNVTTGPLLAAALTASLSEQASVWCFFSMFQCFFAFVAAFVSSRKYGGKQEEEVVHAGDLGEAPMVYVMKSSNGVNGSTNGVHKKND